MFAGSGSSACDLPQNWPCSWRVPYRRSPTPRRMQRAAAGVTAKPAVTRTVPVPALAVLTRPSTWTGSRQVTVRRAVLTLSASDAVLLTATALACIQSGYLQRLIAGTVPALLAGEARLPSPTHQ